MMKEGYSPTPEKKEAESKIYEVSFDDEHFGDATKQNDAHTFVEKVSRWFDRICADAGLGSDNKILNEFSYYLIELVKNALIHADGGRIKVIIDHDKITASCTDRGPGIDDLDSALYGAHHGFGFISIVNFADKITIETNGVKYTKKYDDDTFSESTKTTKKQGAKITFVKFI